MGGTGGAPEELAAGSGGAAAQSLSSCSTESKSRLFCEDFESYPTGPAVAANGWMPVTNQGTLTIDSTHAQGKSALKIHTQGNGKAFVQLPFMPPENSFYGRMRIWASAFPTAPDYAHYTLVEASGSQPGLVRPIGGQYIPGKGNLWGPGSDAGPTGDWTNWKESAPTAAQAWQCLEWQLSAANNEIRVWIDGQAKPELTVDTKLHGGNMVDFVFPTFNTIWFGFWLYQDKPTPSELDVWLDDLALSTERLGC